MQKCVFIIVFSIIISSCTQNESSNDFFQKGYAFQEQGEYVLALEEYEKAIEIDPNNFQAWENKGFVLNMMREHGKAVDALDEAIRINPNYYWSWFSIGAAYSELGNLEKAVFSFNRAIEINPGAINAIHLKGIALENFGEFEEALITFDQVLKIWPEFKEPWAIKGSIYKHLKEFDRATEAFSKVLEQSPTDARGYFIMGVALAELGNYEKALEAFDKSISLAPKESDANISKAWLYSTCPDKQFRNGNLALEILKGIDSIRRPHYGTLAATYAEIGNFEQAVSNQLKEIERLKEKGQNKFVQRTNLHERLETYKNKKPYRDYPVNTPKINQ